ncbi:MAG: hypothetical protein JRG91_05935 [Deltaproteobacteria bacterium]|nr:hypothetical protein [Deltaproteobacteria bacterium]
MKSRRNIVSIYAGATIALVAALAPAWGCARNGMAQIRTSGTIVEQDYVSVEVIEEPSLRTKVILPIPRNPYGDDGDCPCVCATGCVADASELRALIAKLTLKATRRADASAAALLKAGDGILAHENWAEVVTSTMDLLNHPTIVIVPLPGGKLKKVSLEKLGTIDLSTTQIFSIKNKIEGKMQSALTVNMIANGIPKKDAKKFSKKIMQVYMYKLLAPSD